MIFSSVFSIIVRRDGREGGAVLGSGDVWKWHCVRWIPHGGGWWWWCGRWERILTVVGGGDVGARSCVARIHCVLHMDNPSVTFGFCATPCNMSSINTLGQTFRLILIMPTFAHYTYYGLFKLEQIPYTWIPISYPDKQWEVMREVGPSPNKSDHGCSHFTTCWAIAIALIFDCYWSAQQKYL